MAFRAYISQDSKTGTEHGFEHPYERAATLQAAKMLFRHYGKSQTDFALIANIEDPPIDLVILSSNGLGIAELKDYSGQVGGANNTPWSILDDKDNSVTQLKSGVYLNPFEQVGSYRRRLFGKLRAFVEKNPRLMPPWLLHGPFWTQAAVVFTAQKFDLSRIKIDPAVSRPWFRLLWLDEIPDWAYSLEFGSGHRLSSTQIDTLATDFFHTRLWTEIEENLDTNEPYGYLWVVTNGTESSPMSLDLDQAVIGRAPEVNLMLDPEIYPLVSRQHASIHKKANLVVITDLESKHGTWVNGERVDQVTGRVLKNGDRIVLGTCDESGQTSTGSCTLVYRAIMRRVEVTASEVINVRPNHS